jgi:hypothetical protein
MTEEEMDYGLNTAYVFTGDIPNVQATIYRTTTMANPSTNLNNTTRWVWNFSTTDGVTSYRSSISMTARTAHTTEDSKLIPIRCVQPIPKAP